MSAEALRDLIGLSGFGLVVYGVSMWSAAGACVTAGAVMFSVSIIGWIRNARTSPRGK